MRIVLLEPAIRDTQVRLILRRNRIPISDRMTMTGTPIRNPTIGAVRFCRKTISEITTTATSQKATYCRRSLFRSESNGIPPRGI
jgi:hypothetical protein